VTERPDAVAVSLLGISLVWRVYEAATRTLNPDEASYFAMSLQRTWGLVYANAMDTHHPALLVFLLHWLRQAGESELVLRLPAVAGGVLFPWFVYRWVSLVGNRTAGLAALLVTAFSPYLVALSAQARGYTMAFTGIAASLYFTEAAVREGSVRRMGAAAGGLWLAILSEYFAAFYALGAGLCFLRRGWRERLPARMWMAWAAGQAGGVALYAFLYLTQIRPMLSTEMGDSGNQGWLRGALPWAGENLAVFWAMGVVKQFAWLFGSIPLGVAMMAPFAAGAWLLWRGENEAQRRAGRMAVALTAVLFALAGMGAAAHFHPFGRSRHTAFLGLFLAAGIGVAAERAMRRRPGLLVAGGLAVVPLWAFVSTPDQNNMARARQGRAELREAVAAIRARIPKGTTILAEGDTRYLLLHAMEGAPRREPGGLLLSKDREWMVDGYRMVMYRYKWDTTEEVEADVRRFRADFETGSAPVWVLDGGWDVVAGGPKLARAFRESRDRFREVLWIRQEEAK
jgi:hypothetical protein